MRRPRISEWLLRAAAGRDERDDIAGDLAEEADGRVAQEGERAARRWYRRQVWRSIGPLLARRVSGMRHSSRSGARLAGVTQDLRVAFRSLAASRTFAVSVVLLLALGIGAHTAVYAIVDGLALRPLPFGDRGDRLFTLHSTHPTLAQDWDDSRISYPDLLDLRNESATLEGLEGFIARNVSVSAGRPGSDTERMLAASITPGLFGLLGVAPARGRDFAASDAAPAGSESVAIISHALWRDAFGADRDVIGRPIAVNGRTLTVIGIMPPEFSFPEAQRLWLPYRDDPVERRGSRGILAVGLFRVHVALDRGAAELRAVAAKLAEGYPDTNRDWGVHALPLRAFFVSTGAVTIMLGAVSLVLLVACANVAGLLVARGLGRARELALRAALGAGRLRLMRLLLAEAVMLAAIGGALGLALAAWGIRAFAAWNPEPPPYWAQPVFDVRVAVFGIGLTALVALMTGLLPAIRISRLGAARAVLSGTRAVGATTVAHRRLQRALVAGQVAASFALLVGALVLSRSATALLRADAGFAIEPLLSLRFYIAGDRYNPIDARAAVVEEIVRRVATVPGVRGVAATGSIPADDGGAAIRLLEPGTASPEPREIGAQVVHVTATFWDALGLRLAEGRTFTAAEAGDARADVVIVNQRLASRFWPGESALGRTLRAHDGREVSVVRVVGVAPDLVYEEFSEETPQSQLNVYVPYVRAGWRTQALLVSATAEPGRLARPIREAIQAVDPGFAVFDVLTMTDRRAFNHWAERFVGRTFSAFAVAALLLAIVGAYGIAAYSAALRTREVGVRLAIGATRGDVVRLFMGSGARIALFGVLTGAPVAAGVIIALQGALFRVSAWAPELWVGPPLLLALAVLAAHFLPAQRASRTDPVVALRAE